MIDYSSGLFDPVWDEVAVPATMVTTTGEVTIAVYDNTRAKTQTSGSVEVRSVGPEAHARVPELTAKGVARDQYKGATLTFNGRTWSVRSYDLQGSPNGEDLGLVYFKLMAMS